MIRSVLAGGRAKADAFAGAGEPPRIDQSIQLGHLRRPQDVVDHQIALKIEQVLLQLLVRSVHGHTLPCLSRLRAGPCRMMRALYSTASTSWTSRPPGSGWPGMTLCILRKISKVVGAT